MLMITNNIDTHYDWEVTEWEDSLSLRSNYYNTIYKLHTVDWIRKNLVLLFFFLIGEYFMHNTRVIYRTNEKKKELHSPKYRLNFYWFYLHLPFFDCLKWHSISCAKRQNTCLCTTVISFGNRIKLLLT